MIRPVFAVFVVATTIFVAEGYPGGYPMSRSGMTSGTSDSGTPTTIGRSGMTGMSSKHINPLIADIGLQDALEEFFKNIWVGNADVNMLDHRASGRFGVNVDGLSDFLNAIAGLSEIVGGIIGIGGDEE